MNGLLPIEGVAYVGRKKLLMQVFKQQWSDLVLTVFYLTVSDEHLSKYVLHVLVIPSTCFSKCAYLNIFSTIKWLNTSWNTLILAAALLFRTTACLVFLTKKMRLYTYMVNFTPTATLVSNDPWKASVLKPKPQMIHQLLWLLIIGLYNHSTWRNYC